MITVIMYHYIRPWGIDFFPKVNFLPVDDFERQLAHLGDHYDVLTMYDFHKMVIGGCSLSSGNYALLTFDDGYRDHYDYVAPLLDKYGMPGCFYPVVSSAKNGTVLTANKIHCLLSMDVDARKLCRLMEELIAKGIGSCELNSLDYYRSQYAARNLWDSVERAYFKRMMQHGLPVAVRDYLLDKLMHQMVPYSEQEIAGRLYLSVEELKQLHLAGHHMGGHTASHVWLDKVDDEAIRDEISSSFELIDEISACSNVRSFCYPYGGYNPRVMSALALAGVEVAFTVEPRRLESHGNSLEIPRLDANDFQREVVNGN